MRKWILFDVDDVVVSFRQSMADACKALGRDIPWTDWKSYNHVEIYGFTSQLELRNFMRDARVLENAKVDDYVKYVLQSLRDQGYSIGLITARGWHPEGESITRDMVLNNGLAVDKIVLSYVYTDKKSNFIDQFDGEIVAFLDDSPHHVQDFLEHGINACVLNRPWNIEDVELPRVHSIKLFLDYIKQLEPRDISVADTFEYT